MNRALLSLALVAITASTAGADNTLASPSMTHATPVPAPAPTWEHPLYYFGGGVSGRVLGLDGASESYVDILDAYGYDNTGKVVMGAYLFGGFRALPIVDVGLVGEYSYIQNAQPSDKEISMRTHAKQLGVFARPRITRIGSTADLGVRGEFGVIHSSTTLRQEDMTEMSPYARAEIELMVGGERMGAHLHVGYMLSFSRDDFEPHIAPALGGLSFGVGIYRRY